MRRPGPRAARLLGGLALLVAVLAGGLAVANRWDDVRPALVEVGALRVLAATVVTGLGVVATACSWRAWLLALGGRLPALVAHRLFYVTQAGKFVPGSVWPYVAQAAVARRFGLEPSLVLTTSTLFLLGHLGTGVAVGAVLLVGAPALDPLLRAGLLAAGSVSLLALAPPVLRRLLRLLRLLRPLGLAARPDVVVPWRGALGALAWMLAAWAAYGGAGALLAGRAGVVVTGATALAWVVGFLAVVAPAGAGAREAAFVLLAAPTLGVATALAVTLLARVAGTVADLLLAAASWPGRPWAGQHARRGPAVGS